MGGDLRKFVIRGETQSIRAFTLDVPNREEAENRQSGWRGVPGEGRFARLYTWPEDAYKPKFWNTAICVLSGRDMPNLMNTVDKAP